MKNFKSAKMLATIALSATILSGCAAFNKDAVITINDRPITKHQYETAFDEITKNSMFAQMGVDIKKDPDSFLHLMLKDRVVNELIVKNLLDQEIKKKNIKVTNDDINKELKNIIDQVGSKEKFNEILKQNGISAAKFKKDLEEEVKIKKLVDSLQTVKVSDREIENYYKKNLDKFKNPERVRASHILVSANKDEIREIIVTDEKNKGLTAEEVDVKVKEDLAQKLEKAKKILAEAKKDPAQFAKLAKDNSDDVASAKQGGDLGFFAQNDMVPEFSKVAFSQTPNTVSEVVTTPYGYHIILVTDRQAAGIQPFEKVKGDIAAFLANQEKVTILQKYVDKLKNDASIVYNDPSFDPAAIQKKIKDEAAKNPALKQSQQGAK